MKTKTHELSVAWSLEVEDDPSVEAPTGEQLAAIGVKFLLAQINDVGIRVKVACVSDGEESTEYVVHEDDLA